MQSLQFSQAVKNQSIKISTSPLSAILLILHTGCVALWLLYSERSKCFIQLAAFKRTFSV